MKKVGSSLSKSGFVVQPPFILSEHILKDIHAFYIITNIREIYDFFLNFNQTKYPPTAIPPIINIFIIKRELV